MTGIKSGHGLVIAKDCTADTMGRVYVKNAVDEMGAPAVLTDAHTQGPWTVEFSTEWPFDISIKPDVLTVHRVAHASSQKTISDCRNAVGFDHAERDSVMDMIATQEANAHMWAASLDLLAVAESVVAWADQLEQWLDIPMPLTEAAFIAAARAAIAKAKGVQS